MQNRMRSFFKGSSDEPAVNSDPFRCGVARTHVADPVHPRRGGLSLADDHRTGHLPELGVRFGGRAADVHAAALVLRLASVRSRSYLEPVRSRRRGAIISVKHQTGWRPKSGLLNSLAMTRTAPLPMSLRLAASHASRPYTRGGGTVRRTKCTDAYTLPFVPQLITSSSYEGALQC
jgi:hypothetical protein